MGRFHFFGTHSLHPGVTRISGDGRVWPSRTNVYSPTTESQEINPELLIRVIHLQTLGLHWAIDLEDFGSFCSEWLAGSSGATLGLGDVQDGKGIIRATHVDICAGSAILEERS
jgi:hypothetical protein